MKAARSDAIRPGLLPVEGVSGAGIHQEPRARDRRRERLLIASRKDCVLISPHDEGGGFDLVELPQGIVFQESLERRSPHPRRDLQVLLHDGFEKRLRHRLGKGALRKLAHEVGSIGSVNFEMVESHISSTPGLSRRVAGEPKKHEPQGALGVVYREAPGDEAAAGTADDDGCFEMERVHERRQVRREIAGMIARSRDGSHHRGPSASRRRRGWSRAGQTARARRSARSPRWRAQTRRERPMDLPVRHTGASPGWEAQLISRQAPWFVSSVSPLNSGPASRPQVDITAYQAVAPPSTTRVWPVM